MKKLIYGIVFFAIAGISVLVACSKQDVQPTPSKPQQLINIEKSGSFNDAQLIDIIKGRNSSYSKIEEIEEVLFEHCRLSSSVLRVLIDETRMPNYIVEEMMILSAPSSADLTYLNTVRPSLSRTSIVAADNIDLLNSQFAICNSNPRQIFIAKGLTRTALCEDGCGESEFKGTDFVILNLTSTTTPLDPAQIADCNAGRWVCGKLVESRVVLSDGTSTTAVIKCEGTVEKCVRKVTQTK